MTAALLDMTAALQALVAAMQAAMQAAILMTLRLALLTEIVKRSRAKRGIADEAALVGCLYHCPCFNGSVGRECAFPLPVNE
jgi:hypothetical protein